MARVAVHTGSIRRGVLLPDHYCWMILLGALDVMCTWIVLKLGGIEANAIADVALQAFGKWGLIGLKFVALALVIAICEYVGRHNRRRAVQVADIAIALNATPVVLAMIQLYMR